MQKTQMENREEITLDLSVILRVLWKRAWIVAIAMVLAGALAFVYSAVMITPTYRSSFTTYVNNRLNPEGVGTTSVNDLSASMGLAYVYQEVIISRSVLTEAAQASGAELSYNEVAGMVSASVSQNTPIITVHVEATDPELAVQLATAIAEVAPKHVERVVEGSSMRIVDEPLLPTSKYSPSNGRNAIIGALIGFILSAGVIILLELLHDKVQNGDDLEERYGITVLGSIPDLQVAQKHDSHHYGYNKAGGDK